MIAGMNEVLLELDNWSNVISEYKVPEIPSS